jgi:hypothetical protein
MTQTTIREAEVVLANSDWAHEVSIFESAATVTTCRWKSCDRRPDPSVHRPRARQGSGDQCGAKGGDDPKLKDWAGKTLPALRYHLDMAQAMNNDRK